MNLVKKAFLSLDRNIVGRTSVLSVYKQFDVAMNQEFLANKKTKDQLFHEFISSIIGHNWT